VKFDNMNNQINNLTLEDYENLYNYYNGEQIEIDYIKCDKEKLKKYIEKYVLFNNIDSWGKVDYDDIVGDSCGLFKDKIGVFNITNINLWGLQYFIQDINPDASTWRGGEVGYNFFNYIRFILTNQIY